MQNSTEFLIAWETYGDCVIDESKNVHVPSHVPSVNENVVNSLSHRAAAVALAVAISLMSLSPSGEAWASDLIPAIIAPASDEASLDKEVESILKGDSSDKKSEASGSEASGSTEKDPGTAGSGSDEGTTDPDEGTDDPVIDGADPNGEEAPLGTEADAPEADDAMTAMAAMDPTELDEEPMFELMAVDPKAVKSEEELVEAIAYNEGQGQVTLAADIELTSSVVIPESAALTINLNGHSVKGPSGAVVFTMRSQASLNVTGSGAINATYGPALASNASTSGGLATLTQDGPSISAKTLYTTNNNWSYAVNSGTLTLSQTVTMGDTTQLATKSGSTFTSTGSPYAVVINGASKFDLAGSMSTSQSAIQINNVDAETSIAVTGKLTVASGNAITCTTDIKQITLNGTVIAQTGKVFAVIGDVTPSIKASDNAHVNDNSIAKYLPQGRFMYYDTAAKNAANPFSFISKAKLDTQGYTAIVDGVYCLTPASFEAMIQKYPTAEVVGNEQTVTFYQENGTTVVKTLKIFRGEKIGGAHANLAGVDVSAPTDAEMAALGGADSKFLGWRASDGTVYTRAQLADIAVNADTSYVAEYQDAYQRFDITFKFGVNGAQQSVSRVKEGSAVAFPSAADAPSGSDDYALEGWYTAQTGGTKVAGADGVAIAGTAAAAVTANATYYAHYSYVGNYDVTFSYKIDSDAAALGTAPTTTTVVKVKAGQTVGVSSIPTAPTINPRLEFAGWYKADASGNPTGEMLSPDAVGATVVNGATKFVGVYVRATFDVTFTYQLSDDAKALGVTAPASSVLKVKAAKNISNSGEAVPTPPALSKCTFVGWQKADAQGKPTGSVLTADKIATTSVNQATTYIGIYDAVSFDVTFTYQLADDAKGLGVTAPTGSTVSVKAGKTLTGVGESAPTAPALNKCTFVGWYAADASGNPTGNVLTAAQVGAAVVNGATKYVGVYEAVSYNVTFAYSLTSDATALGLAAPGSSVMQVKAGKTLADAGKAVPTPSALSQCTFVGWYKADAQGKPTGNVLTAAQIAATKVDGATRYVGVYDAATYNITFSYYLNPNTAGLGVTKPDTVIEQVKAGKTLANSGKTLPHAPTLSGCTFDGWFAVDASGNPTGNHLSETKIETAVVSGNATYVGVYEKTPDVTYQVTYSWGMEGVGSGVQSSAVTIGEGKEVKSFPAASKVCPPKDAHGYWKVQGWYTAPTGGTKVADADGHAIAGTAAANVQANATFYAQYAYIHTYDITFNWGTACVDDHEEDVKEMQTLQRTVDQGQTLAAHLPSQSQVDLSGYTFTGWYDAAGSKLNANAPVQANEVYTARYERIKTPVDPGNQNPVVPGVTPGTTQPSDDPGAGSAVTSPNRQNTSRNPRNPFTPWNPAGLAQAAGFTVPAAGPGVVVLDELPSPTTNASGSGDGDNDDVAVDNVSLYDADEMDGSSLPISSADVVLVLAGVGGVGLAALIGARVAGFLSTNARFGRGRRRKALGLD